MSKDQIVSDAKSSLIAGQDAVLSQVIGDVYDKAVAEVPPAPGGFTQADIDSAVSAATAPLTEQITALTSDDEADKAKIAEEAAQIDTLNSTVEDLGKQISDLTAKLEKDDKIVLGFKNSLSKLQAVVAALQEIQPDPEVPPEA